MGFAMFLSLRGVAAYTGLSENTLKAYSQRGYMPAPDVRIGTGEKVTANGWSTDTIDHWLANRPGRGARTDLKKAQKPNGGSVKNGSKTPKYRIQKSSRGWIRTSNLPINSRTLCR